MINTNDNIDTWWIILSDFALFYLLTHFSPMLPFYNPCKRQKNFDFYRISMDIEMEYWDRLTT